jgi:hypothetical protein
MILLCLLHLKVSTQVKNSNPLEGAVGSVIETNIEGIESLKLPAKFSSQ